LPVSPLSRDDRRRLLLAIAAGVVGLAALALLTRAVAGDFRLLTAVGRPILFAAVGALALQGRRWARAVLAFWAGSLAILNVVAGANLAAGGHARDGALFGALGSVFLVAVVLLLRTRFTSPA
jgi:hypothetical protein